MVGIEEPEAYLLLLPLLKSIWATLFEVLHTDIPWHTMEMEPHVEHPFVCTNHHPFWDTHAETCCYLPKTPCWMGVNALILITRNLITNLSSSKTKQTNSKSLSLWFVSRELSSYFPNKPLVALHIFHGGSCGSCWWFVCSIEMAFASHMTHEWSPSGFPLNGFCKLYNVQMQFKQWVHGQILCLDYTYRCHLKGTNQFSNLNQNEPQFSWFMPIPIGSHFSLKMVIP